MITESLAAQVIIDILNSEMNMPANSIWLRQQNRTIPNDNGLYIAVGLVSAQTVGNTTEMDTLVNPATGLPAQYEINTVQQQEVIQIDILSSATDPATGKPTSYAMLRNWEVIAALQSFYSQQLQEKNNFKIFRIPRSFIDTSSAEGGSMLQRYTIVVTCFVWYRKQKLFNDYYDDFTVRADDEKTIGTATPLLEFEIDQSTPPPPYP